MRRFTHFGHTSASVAMTLNKLTGRNKVPNMPCKGLAHAHINEHTVDTPSANAEESDHPVSKVCVLAVSRWRDGGRHGFTLRIHVPICWVYISTWFNPVHSAWHRIQVTEYGEREARGLR